MTRWTLAAAAAAVLLTAAPGAPRAQSSDLGPLVDRLERLERDIRTLSRQVATGDSAPLVSGETPGAANLSADPAAVARLNVRIDALEGDLRSVTGRIEEVLHEVNRVSQRLDKLVSDMDYRMTALEQGAGRSGASAPAPAAPAAGFAPAAPTAGQPAAVPPPAPAAGTLGTISPTDLSRVQPAPGATTAAAAPLAVGTPKEQYDHAFELLRRAKYAEAEQALTAFIDNHGDDPLARNARYWLGETYYVREEFELAAKTFLDSYKKAEDGPKAPDSLLKLGMSLSRIDKQRQACLTFVELARKFPNAPGSIKTKMEEERQRAGCQ